MIREGTTIIAAYLRGGVGRGPVLSPDDSRGNPLMNWLDPRGREWSLSPLLSITTCSWRGTQTTNVNQLR